MKVKGQLGGYVRLLVLIRGDGGGKPPLPELDVFFGGGELGEVFFGGGAEFAADDVGGEAGAEQAAIDGGELAVVNRLVRMGAAKRFQFAVNALADHLTFVFFLKNFLKSRFDVAVGNAAAAEVAGDAEFSLAAGFGGGTGELAGATGILARAPFFSAGAEPAHPRLVSPPRHP